MCKMNKFAKKAAEMDAWAGLLDFAKDQLRYVMDVKYDDNGEPVLDEDGNNEMKPPTEDSYKYARYVGWCEVIKTLENMKL